VNGSAVDDGSGAADVADDSDIFYFFLPRVGYTCSCIAPHFGPACQFERHPGALAGSVSFALEIFVSITGTAATSWSAVKTISTQRFFSRLLTHFSPDIVVGVPAATSSRARRQAQPTSAILIVNVTNIATATRAAELRAIVSDLNASTFPGFILAGRIEAATVEPLTVRVRNTTAAFTVEDDSSDRVDTRGLILVVVGATTAVLLLVAIAMVVLNRRKAHEPAINNVTYMPAVRRMASRRDEALAVDARARTDSTTGPVSEMERQGSTRHYYPPASEAYIDPYPTLDRKHSVVARVQQGKWKPSDAIAATAVSAVNEDAR